jgi:hypothetical protein
MIKTIYTCDHCGKDVPNTYNDRFHAVFMYASKKPNVDACCEEHLGFAVAKAFGIPIDGNQAMLLDEYRASNAALTKSVEQLRAEWNELHGHYTAAKAEIRSLQEQLAHTPPPPNTDGKTPWQVAFVAFAHEMGLNADVGMVGHESVRAWDAAAHAVLSAFAPDATQAVREALGRVRERIAGMGFGEAERSLHEYVLGAIDAELSTLPAADLTGPKKPTKPVADHVHELGSCSFCEKKAPRAIATNCTICGCSNERAFLELCRGDAKHNFDAP